jgi:tRNA(fMet)-specific endonuclease VapC
MMKALNLTSICGQIRARLANVGIPIDAYDVQIAAIALSNNLTLVTHNTREFEQTEGLQDEDWVLESERMT